LGGDNQRNGTVVESPLHFKNLVKEIGGGGQTSSFAAKQEKKTGEKTLAHGGSLNNKSIRTTNIDRYKKGRAWKYS